MMDTKPLLELLERALEAIPHHSEECGCDGCEVREAISHALKKERCGNCGGPDPCDWCPDCKKNLCGGCSTSDPHNEPDPEQARLHEEYEHGGRADQLM